jgi:hypothetical protein
LGSRGVSGGETLLFAAYFCSTSPSMRLGLVACRPTPTNEALAAAELGELRWEPMTPHGALELLRRGDVALGRLDVVPTLDGTDDGLWLSARSLRLASRSSRVGGSSVQRSGSPRPESGGRTSPSAASAERSRSRGGTPPRWPSRPPGRSAPRSSVSIFCPTRAVAGSSPSSTAPSSSRATTRLARRLRGDCVRRRARGLRTGRVRCSRRDCRARLSGRGVRSARCYTLARAAA